MPAKLIPHKASVTLLAVFTSVLTSGCEAQTPPVDEVSPADSTAVDLRMERALQYEGVLETATGASVRVRLEHTTPVTIELGPVVREAHRFGETFTCSAHASRPADLSVTISDEATGAQLFREVVTVEERFSSYHFRQPSCPFPGALSSFDAVVLARSTVELEVGGSTLYIGSYLGLPFPIRVHNSGLDGLLALRPEGPFELTFDEDEHVTVHGIGWPSVTEIGVATPGQQVPRMLELHRLE